MQRWMCESFPGIISAFDSRKHKDQEYKVVEHFVPENEGNEII